MSLINVTNLTFSYPGGGENVFTGASFSIDTDWRLGFCGRNGRGKTTFLKLLSGMYEYSGTISPSVGFTYFPPSVSEPAGSALDVVEGFAPGAALWEIQKEFGKLGLDAGAAYRPFSTLSPGERTKALLAGLFLKENSLLLIA